MISVRGLTKEYGGVRAVDDLTFDVEAGKVTGFLGPNGAGKSTTMRMVMGLDRPSAGTATVNGRRYADLATPLREVGALLDAGAMHPGRTGRAHLRVAARTSGIPLARVDEVIEQVGLGRPPAGGSRATPSACGSGSASPPRCWATRACCCSTSRSTASTSTGSGGSGRCCAASPTRGAPSWSPAT